jgi:hypothetical protein
MKKRLFLVGMFSIVLAFGLVVIGCDDGSADDDGGGGGGSSLEGTWSKPDNSAIRFSGNNLQSTADITAINVNWTQQGTYTYTLPTLIVTPPPQNGVVQNPIQGTAVINGIQLTITGFIEWGFEGNWTRQQ